MEDVVAMVLAVFIVGLANLALGFALAWGLERAGVTAGIGGLVPALRLAFRGGASTPTAAAAVKNSDTGTNSEASPTGPAPYIPPQDAVPQPTAEISAEWLKMLSEVEGCKTFVEAAAATLRLEVGRYRDQLIEVDVRVRRLAARAEKGSPAQILLDLAAANANWLERQVVAARNLQSRRGNSGTLAPEGRRLEAILPAQTAQIESTARMIEALDFQGDFARAGTALLHKVGALLDDVHALRDAMHGALVAITVADHRLESLDKKLHVDGLTDLVNRSGLESVLQDFWHSDPERKRPLAAVLIDIDRFGRINQDFGVPVGDRFLAAFAKLLDRTVRAERPNDTIARLEGQRFVVLAVNGSAQDLLGPVERFRQTIAGSTFEFDQRRLSLKTSCGLVEAQPLDTSATLLARLHSAVLHAKQSGRDCTCLELAGAPELIESAPLKIAATNIVVT